MLLDPRVHEALQADLPALAALADQGVDFEAFTDDEIGPELNALMMAARFGLPAQVDFLLSRVDPRARNSSGETALHYAAIKGSPECVALIAAAADANQLDRRGESALMDAATYLHLDCVKILLPLTHEPERKGWRDQRSAARRALDSESHHPQHAPGVGDAIAALIEAERARREALAIHAALDGQPSPARAPRRAL